MCAKINENEREVIGVDIANKIRELRERAGMNKKAFSEYTKIPIRTLEDWEAGRRTPPEYLPRLLAYQLKYDELMKEREAMDGESD